MIKRWLVWLLGWLGSRSKYARMDARPDYIKWPDEFKEDYK